VSGVGADSLRVRPHCGFVVTSRLQGSEAVSVDRRQLIGRRVNRFAIVMDLHQLALGDCAMMGSLACLDNRVRDVSEGASAIIGLRSSRRIDDAHLEVSQCQDSVSFYDASRSCERRSKSAARGGVGRPVEKCSAQPCNGVGQENRGGAAEAAHDVG